MKNPLKWLTCDVFGVLLLFSPTAFALDVVNFAVSEYAGDTNIYREQLLQRALEVTEPDFGPFELNLMRSGLSRHRALSEVVRAGKINTFIMVYYPEWSQKTYVVPIPTMRGLLSYRLLLVNKNNAHKFSDIKSLEDLKKLRVGTLKRWSLTNILESQGFNIVRVETRDALFKMLDAGRFDYLMRGANEVFMELASPKISSKENIILEKNIKLVLPMPQYFYVSLREPGLAKRLNVGMQRLLENGTLDDLLEEHYGESVKQARLESPINFHLVNPDIPASFLEKPCHWIHLENDK